MATKTKTYTVTTIKTKKQKQETVTFTLTAKQSQLLGALMWFITQDRTPAAYGTRELLRFTLTEKLPEHARTIKRDEDNLPNDPAIDALAELAEAMGML